MPKFSNASEETAAMERQEAMNEKPQDRLAGRLKFTGCHECGSQDGMQAVHRETLKDMASVTIQWLAGKYQYQQNDEELFYPCHFCNPGKTIPDGYEPMEVADVMAWLDRDQMQPDYAALAAEEPLSQIEDSRDSAGL